MADIHAPNSSAAEPEPVESPHAGADAPDAAPRDALERSGDSLDDLLRDIGATCGGDLRAGDTVDGREPGKVSDWFSRAIDQLGSGDAPESERDAPTAPVAPDAAADLAEDASAVEVIPPAQPDVSDPVNAEIRAVPAAPAETPPESTPSPASDDATDSRIRVADPILDDAPVVPAPDAHPSSEEENGDIDPLAGATFVGVTEAAGAEPAPSNAPASPEPAASAGGPPDDVDLRRLDDALADDVEALLQGSFDTVSAVLDDKFGDVAPAATAMPPEPEQEDERAAQPDAAPADAIAPPSPAESASVPLPSRGDAVPEQIPPTVAELLDPGDRHPTPPEPSDDADAEPDPSAVAETVPPEAPPATETDPPVSPAASMDEPARTAAALIEILAIVNVPMRYVPPSLRPVVDWVALSLVFWVPIVWVIALFMVGQRA